VKFVGSGGPLIKARLQLVFFDTGSDLAPDFLHVWLVFCGYQIIYRKCIPMLPQPMLDEQIIGRVQQPSDDFLPFNRRALVRKEPVEACFVHGIQWVYEYYGGNDQYP
jgi:hypothetical protein